MILVSVHDTKADSFSAPMTTPNKATALRDFSTAVNQPGSLLNSHPDDFVLIQLGEFDERTGGIKIDFLALGSGRDVLVKDVK